MPVIFTPAATTSHPDVVPYISTSDYTGAPTAVDSSALVYGGTGQQSLVELANVIRRASGWANSLCKQILAATLDVQMSSNRLVDSDGNIRLPCDFFPVLELDTCTVGPTPSTMAAVTQTSDIWLDGRKVLVVPVAGLAAVTNSLVYPGPLGPGARVFAQWSYWNGWPHTTLAANVAAAATTLTVQTTQPQALAGRAITIWDGANTEQVTVASTFAGGTALTLAAATAFAHTVPTAPQSITVSTFPDDIRQGVISLTSALIKTRGAQSYELPTVGQPPTRQQLLESGGLEDLVIATKLLDRYRRVA
jgi:hypothetical protein